jgi:methyl-accepting chemotaxis protein
MRYFNRLSFKLKIIAMVVMVTLVGIFSTLVVSYLSSKNSLMNMSKDQLNSIASISKTRAIDFLNRSKTFTALLGKDRLTEGLILAYESAFYANGKTIGKDEVLNSSAFKNLNNVYKSKVEEQVNSFQIAKYMLANIQGQIVFTSDFDIDGKIAGRSLTNGALKDTRLAKCLNEALNSKENNIYYADFEFISIIQEAQAYYCVKSVAEFDHLSEGIKKGDPMGVVIVEISKSILNKILSDRSGMGETGQAYILGDDGLLKSDFFINSEKYNVKNILEKNIIIKNKILD